MVKLPTIKMALLCLGLTLTSQSVKATELERESVFAREYAEGREEAKRLASTAGLYKGKPITPESILKFDKIDASTKKAIKAWLRENRVLVSTLVNLPMHGQIPARQKRREEALALIKEKGFENISYANYIFSIDLPLKDKQVKHTVKSSTALPGELSGIVAEYAGKKYLVKIAGPANQRENYNGMLGNPYGTTFETQEEYDKHNVSTYQNISRKAHALRLSEWIEQNPEAGIVVPATQLVHVPGADKEVSDKNYIIMEEYVENIGSPGQHPRTLLSKIPALVRAVVYTGMWDINPGQFLISPQGKVVCIDLEQPNNSSPCDFFHKNQDKYVGNVGCGLGQLEQMEKDLRKQEEDLHRQQLDKEKE